MTGNQVPTFSNIGESVDATHGLAATQLATVFTQPPMPWQAQALDVMLAYQGEPERYRYPAVGISVPRQNGKSEIVRARCLYGLVSVGERILYTCQHGDTADEMFRQLAAPFEDEEQPELGEEHLKSVRRANGQQAIYLKNGGYIRFTTRTNSIARGRSYDVLIYDEAQELTDGEQAASMPAVSASHLHNPQVIYLGTPPTPDFAGGVFKRLHDLAHQNAPSAPAWMEWSVPEVGDVTDTARWYTTNPSLGTLIDEPAVRAELVMAPDVFARERLGWWSEAASAVAIPPKLWAAAGIGRDAIPADGKKAFAVKFAPDGHAVSLAVCLAPQDGPAHVELVDVHALSEGVDWASKYLTRDTLRRKTACIVVDGRNGAAPLLQSLRSRYPRQAVVEASSATVVAASSMLMDALNTGALTHWADEDQNLLDWSVQTSTRRRIGHDGGWGFDGPDSTAIEACALALWGARTTRRNPGRGSMIL